MKTTLRGVLAPASRRRALAGFAFTAAMSAVLVRRMQGFFPDDAFITFRYAENLASGRGWVYNPGQHGANGATSPLYTLLLAVVHHAGIGILLAANIVYVLSMGTIAGGLILLYDRARATLVAPLSIAFLVSCGGIALAKGMETTLFLAIAVMALVLFDRRREVALGVCLALLVLVRGDGILLATALFGLTWVRARAFPWRMLLAAAVTALPWTVYAISVLGSVLPDTLAAKVAQSKSGFWGHGELLVRGFSADVDRFGYRTWLRVATPLAAVGLVRAAMEVRFRAVTLAFIGAAAAQVFVYSVVLRVPNYSWYYVWGLAAIAVLAGLGISSILELVIAGLRVPGGIVTAIIAGLTLLAVVAYVPVQHLTIYQPYLTAADWVRTNTPPGSTVAATEIGVIGWNDARPAVDYLGLLDHTSISELRRGDLTSWLARSQPNFWITHDPMWGFELPAAQTALFAQHYRRVFADQGLAIFERDEKR